MQKQNEGTIHPSLISLFRGCEQIIRCGPVTNVVDSGKKLHMEPPIEAREQFFATGLDGVDVCDNRQSLTQLFGKTRVQAQFVASALSDMLASDQSQQQAAVQRPTKSQGPTL